jgi:hypothetical protein
MAVPGNVQQQVYDLLSQASNLSFVSADQEQGPRVGFVPGQRLTAQVLLTLPDNRTQVQIGTQRFNMELPMAVRPGQTLDMTYVTDDPRTTFAIARQGAGAPPVAFSDASRLLSLLVGSEQITDPKLRASLQGIGDMLRRSSGETAVLANLMDEALTYGDGRGGGPAPQARPAGAGTTPQTGSATGWTVSPEQARLASFESNASQILQHVARNSRFVLTEAANQPVTPLPLVPGDEVDAAVVGTLPGGRVFVQVAGASLELLIPRTVQTGDILRLTFISSQPRPLFALPRGGAGVPSVISEAGRWLSTLEHGENGVSDQQIHLLDQLSRVLKNLPPDSVAFSAFLDEAVTYESAVRERLGASGPRPSGTDPGLAAVQMQMPSLLPGNGIVLGDDMAKLLQALIRGNRLALLEATGQQASATGFLPGQQLRGEVVALLGGGRFMVQVADRLLEFSIPKGAALGERISLFFIAAAPQPSFLMLRAPRQGGDAQVSDTGRWLSTFLAAGASKTPLRESFGAVRTLLAGPMADAPFLSRVLQQGLRESGLFYESHLARWFGGDYPLEDLLREPQGRLSPLRQRALVPAGGGDAGTFDAGMKGLSLETMEAAFKKAASAPSHEGFLDRQLVPVVREQLTALQQGEILFRGDLVPGQRLEWSVREREARRNGAGGQERSWETSLAVNMPNLGSVNARLTLDGSRVWIEVRAENAVAAERLRGGRGILAGQLEAAGLTPAEIGIGHEAS